MGSIGLGTGSMAAYTKSGRGGKSNIRGSNLPEHIHRIMQSSQEEAVSELPEVTPLPPYFEEGTPEAYLWLRKERRKIFMQEAQRLNFHWALRRESFVERLGKQQDFLILQLSKLLVAAEQRREQILDLMKMIDGAELKLALLKKKFMRGGRRTTYRQARDAKVETDGEAGPESPANGGTGAHDQEQVLDTIGAACEMFGDDDLFSEDGGSEGGAVPPDAGFADVPAMVPEPGMMESPSRGGKSVGFSPTHGEDDDADSGPGISPKNVSFTEGKRHSDDADEVESRKTVRSEKSGTSEKSRKSVGFSPIRRKQRPGIPGRGGEDDMRPAPTVMTDDTSEGSFESAGGSEGVHPLPRHRQKRDLDPYGDTDFEDELSLLAQELGLLEDVEDESMPVAKPRRRKSMFQSVNQSIRRTIRTTVRSVNQSVGHAMSHRISKISKRSNQTTKAWTKCCGYAERVVSHPYFEIWCMLIIFCQTIIMGITSDWEARQLYEDNYHWFGELHESFNMPPSLAKNITADIAVTYDPQTVVTENPWFVENVEWIFYAWYIFEICLKLLVQRRRFFNEENRSWNFFDIFCVLPWQVLTGGSSGSFFRILRLARLARMLRMIRLMKFFKELRLMMYMVAASFRLVLFSFLVVALLIFFFSIVIMFGIQGYFADPPDGGNFKNGTIREQQPLTEFWGGVWPSMRTLFWCATSGYDWDGTVKSLRVVDDGLYFAIFLAYICLVFFGFFNMLIGLFCEVAATQAVRDEHVMRLEEEKFGYNLKRQAGRKLKSIDAEKSNQITWEEFKTLAKTKEVHKYLEWLSLDAKHAKQLFRALAGSDHVSVDIDEFLIRCGQVKGNLSARRLTSIRRDQHYYMKQMKCLMVCFQENMDRLHQPMCLQPEEDIPVVSLGPRLRVARTTVSRS